MPLVGSGVPLAGVYVVKLAAVQYALVDMADVEMLMFLAVEMAIVWPSSEMMAA